jgi:mannose-6-phosphate isomerase-like protein (cupin superfamily)
MTRPTSKALAEHYTWGDACDGWRLVNRPDLSVIQERMPPNTTERRHHHQRARQFFFVLRGALVIEVEGTVHTLEAEHGLHIEPGQRHQVRNPGPHPAEFLVISEPTTAGDRIEEP